MILRRYFFLLILTFSISTAFYVLHLKRESFAGSNAQQKKQNNIQGHRFALINAKVLDEITI